MTDKLNAALRYISRGWHVFPLNGIVDGRCSCGRPSCDRGGKHPFKGTHGFKEASNDPAQITLWWTRRPYANMGVALEASGLQLLDVDPRNGGDATFEALPEELKAQIRRTLTAETGGGGWHYIFRCNGTNPIGKVKGGGIDVRQVGYFIAAPSSHISGKTYRWVDEAQEPTDPPESLVVEAKEAGPRPLPRDPGRGEQNDALCSLAGTLRRRGMDEGQIYGQLTEYSREWSPPAREAKIREIAAWASQKAANEKELAPYELAEALGFRVLRVVQYQGSKEYVVAVTELGEIHVGRMNSLLSQAQFRARATAAIQRPFWVKRENWPKVVRALMPLIEVVPVPDATDGETMRSMLRDFLDQSVILEFSQAKKAQLTYEGLEFDGDGQVSPPWSGIEFSVLRRGDEYWLRLTAFTQWMNARRRIPVGRGEVAVGLARIGAENRQLRVTEAWRPRLWLLPDLAE